MLLGRELRPGEATATGYGRPLSVRVASQPPYLHNGSVPTLWGILNPNVRPRYWEASGGEGDYDHQWLGLRVRPYDSYPEKYKSGSAATRRMLFDTTVPGASRDGHDFACIRSLSLEEKVEVFGISEGDVASGTVPRFVNLYRSPYCFRFRHKVTVVIPKPFSHTFQVRLLGERLADVPRSTSSNVKVDPPSSATGFGGREYLGQIRKLHRSSARKHDQPLECVTPARGRYRASSS